MYLSRRVYQSSKEFIKKLHKSREFYAKDVSKMTDNRVTGHESRLLEFTREYNRLTANEYDYCKPDALRSLLESKSATLGEKRLLLEDTWSSAKGQVSEEDLAEFEETEKETKTNNLENETEIEAKTDDSGSDQSKSEHEIMLKELSELKNEVKKLESQVAKLENTVNRLPETFDENSELSLSLEEYEKRFVQQAERMDKVFQEHNAGWHAPQVYKKATMEDMPVLETENFRHEVLFVPGYDWLLDTTTRKLPKGGNEGILQRFPHIIERNWLNKLTFIVHSVVFMGKEKPIRESDKILYHSRFGISIDPERIMHKIKTVDNKFDHRGSYTDYMHNINRYYLKNVFINSVCLGMI